MKITALIAKRAENPHENKLPTIAFLGDSVTQGCFEIYQKNDRSFETVFDSENGYPAKVKSCFRCCIHRLRYTLSMQV